MILLLGCLSFLLFVLGDLNSVNWGVRALRPCFFAGCLLLAGSTAALLITARPRFLLPAPLRGLAGFFGALFLLLLVYSLFFALPFQQTYLEEAAERRAYDRGVYALCRHPGVLWFILFYLCCWLVRGSDALFWAWILFSLLNVGYIVLQDLYHLSAHLRQLRRIPEDHPLFDPEPRQHAALRGNDKGRRGAWA